MDSYQLELNKTLSSPLDNAGIEKLQQRNIKPKTLLHKNHDQSAAHFPSAISGSVEVQDQDEKSTQKLNFL